MSKIAGAFDVFLRVLLSVALVVTFTPIVNEKSYAAETPADVRAEEGNGLDDASQAQSSVIDIEDNSLSSSKDALANTSSTAADDDADLTLSIGSGEGGTASSEPWNASNGADAALAENEESADVASRAQSVYGYGILNSNGYIYPCDSEGAPLNPINSADPRRNAISGQQVEVLIVDYDTRQIPRGLCAGSTNLREVRFSRDAIEWIDDEAFYECTNLSEISFGGMVVGHIGYQAFYKCSSLKDLHTSNTTINYMEEGCFSYSGLVSTGLGEVSGLTSIPISAYEHCSNLVDTGLGSNNEIEVLNNSAFSYCESLLLTGLETNTSVRIVSTWCFEYSNLSGGLVLPQGSQVTKLGSHSFEGTNLDYVYFQCDHAVEIGHNTFPKSGMQVMVPSDVLKLYETGDIGNIWIMDNARLPVDVADCISGTSIVSDPDRMEYLPLDDSVSLRDMIVEYDYGGNRSRFDYNDLKNYAFGQFFASNPSDGEKFMPKMHGTYIHVHYDDGVQSFDSYSNKALHEKGDNRVTVTVAAEGAGEADAVEGGGQFEKGVYQTVHATCNTPGRTFAYWKDRTGKILSEDEHYYFKAEDDIVLIAVFADEVTIRPEARLGSLDGPVTDGVKFSMYADGVGIVGDFTTYVGKTYSLTCNYDRSMLRSGFWMKPDGTTQAGVDTVECTAVAGDNNPVCVLVEHGQVNVLAKSIGNKEWGIAKGSGDYDLGETATLVASAHDGGKFLGWMHNGEYLREDAVYYYKVNDFEPITAWFGPDLTHMVAVQAASAQPELGSVEGAGIYIENEQVALSATPAAGCEFAGWTCDGQPIEGGSTFSIVAQGKAIEDGKIKVSPKYEAQFKHISVDYSQTVDLGERTLMDGVEVPSVSGAAEIGENGQVMLDAAALGMLDEDIDFLGWYDKATGTQLSESVSYEFTPVASISLEARFELKDVAVRVNPAESTDKSEEYAHLTTSAFAGYRDAGESVALAAVPDNAQFMGWYASDGADSWVVSDQLNCTYTVADTQGAFASIDITPRYCALPASIVLDVTGTDENGNPPGQFLYSGLYGIGSQVTVVAIPEPGYVLDYVTDERGATVYTYTDESGSAYTFTVKGDTQLTAHFRMADDDEALQALKAALIAALGVAMVAATMYGFGELVDPIAVPAIAEIGAAESIEEVAAVGEEALAEIKEIFDDHKKPHDPDKPDDPSKPDTKRKVEILAAANPAAGGTVIGSGVYREGSMATLEAVANPGYRFVCWMENGVERTIEPRLTIAVTDVTPEVVNAVAVFEKKVSITTGIDVGNTQPGLTAGCSANPEVQTLQRGEEARVTAIAGPDCTFVGWFENGMEVSPSETYIFLAETDRHLVAKFTRPCKVAVEVEPAAQLAGKYIVTGAGDCTAGVPTVLSVELAPAVRNQYSFKGWYRAGSDLLLGTDPSHLEFVPEDGLTTIRAVYEAKEYTITAKAKKTFVERGTVEIAGHAGASSVTCAYGDAVVLKAKANDGYIFKEWKDDKGATYSNAELRVRVTKNATYTAVFTQSTPEVVIAADSWLGGTVMCNGVKVTPATDQFHKGEMLNLTAEPRLGYLFWGWYVNGKLVSWSKEYSTVARGMYGGKGNCTVTAAFKAVDVLCVPTASPADGGTVQASRIVADRGSEVALKATAAPGYVFAGWYSAAGELESTDAEFTCRAMRSHGHVARFEPRTYSIEAAPAVAATSGALVVDAKAGRVEGAGSFDAGTAATLKATACDGYAFEHWENASGEVVSENPEYRFVPSSDEQLYAVFAARQYTINVSADESLGSVDGGGIYAAGDVAEVRATPGEGASFVGWFDAGACVSADAAYSFAVRGDADLQAVFAVGECALSTSAAPAEGGYVSGYGGFSKGDRATLRATARPGFAFDCWKDANGRVVSEQAEYTVEVSADARYTACFSRISYTVSLESSEPGVGVLSGEGIYDFGDTVELNAVQTSDKRFAGWYVIDDAGERTLLNSHAHCWFTLDESLVQGLSDDSLNLQAQFADPYEISVRGQAVVQGKTGARGCRVQGDGVFAAGDKVTLNAVAGMGYRFVGWSLDEAGAEIVETNSALTFSATQDITYYAQFEVGEQVQITVTQSSMFRGKAFLVGIPGQGSTRLYDKGDMFIAMATPFVGLGNHFSHWIDDTGAIVSYSSVYVGFAKQDTQLTAVFYQTGYDVQVLTYPKEAAFSMVALGTGTSYRSAAVMFTIPHEGWKFKYWQDENGMPVGFSPVMTRPVFANRTYTAYYVKEKLSVAAVDPRQGGHIEGSAADGELGYVKKTEIEEGTSVTLTAVPDAGYVFDGWYERGAASDAGPLSVDAVWTFAPEDDTTVEARFKEAPNYQVTATAEHGTVDPANASVAAGGSVEFIAQPNGNCYLESVMVSSAQDFDASEDEKPGASATRCDISDYAGGAYSLKLASVTSAQTVAFGFAEAAAPEITAQPQGVQVREGDAATLSVAADAAASVREHEAASSGAAASHGLRYQWFRVGAEGEPDVELEGETGQTLKIGCVGVETAGAYYCRVTQEYLGTAATAETDRAEVSVAEPDELVFNGGMLPAATAHDEYNVRLTPAQGGTAPYSYRLVEGESGATGLPDGLSFDADMFDITGTPSESGVFTFAVECCDAGGADQQAKTAHFAMAVAPKTIDLAFAGNAFTYNGDPQAPELSGVPAGCDDLVKFAYTGTGDARYSSDAAPADAGTYRAVATLCANGYVGRASAEFTIAPKPVSFAVNAPDATYDGNEHGAMVDAYGANSSDYEVEYRGTNDTEYGPSQVAPRGSGNYAAIVQTTNPNLVGSAAKEFKIGKAPQSISGTSAYSGVYGGSPIILDNAANTSVTFELLQSEDGQRSPVSLRGRIATIESAGQAIVLAKAAESRNYRAAQKMLVIDVAPAKLTVLVYDAERFEGEANPEFSSVLESEADTSGVRVEYLCEADESSAPGEYAIDAKVSDANFNATVVKGTLTVKGAPKIQVTAAAVNGSASPTRAEVVPGGSATFTAQPNENCYLESVTVSDASDFDEYATQCDIADYVGGAYEFALSNITAPKTVTFEFAEAAAPEIIAQPQGVQVREGDAATLSVAADAAASVREHEAASSGAAASHELRYQWFRVDEQGSSQELQGETCDTLRISSVSAETAGTYYCRVTQEYLGTTVAAETDNAEVSVAKPDELVFNGGMLPVATAHANYGADVPAATGGSQPFAYSLAQGSTLPEGLHLKAAADGGAPRIEGTSQESGVFAFSITCTDAAGQAKTARFAIVVLPQPAHLEFSQGSFTYNGSAQAPTLKNVPAGCDDLVKYTYTGTRDTRYSGNAAPTDAGTYRVVATLHANGYVGRATAEFEIAKIPVAFSVDALDTAYDGERHGAKVAARAADAAVDVSFDDYSVTYRGVSGTQYGPSRVAPRDSGSYVASVEATNSNMTGSAVKTFEIAKASQSISGASSYAGVYGGWPIVMMNTANTPVTFGLIEPGEGQANPVSLYGRVAVIGSAGTAKVLAEAAESRNYHAAEQELTINVAPAELTVLVNDAERFVGEANPEFSSVLESEADTSGVQVEYQCEADESSAPGEYAIDAKVNDANYSATVVKGTLTVKEKADPNPEPDPDPDPTPDPGPNPDPGPVPGPDPDKPSPGPSDPTNPTEPDDPTNPSEPNKPGSSDGPNGPNGPSDSGTPEGSSDTAGGIANGTAAANAAQTPNAPKQGSDIAETGDRQLATPFAIAAIAAFVVCVCALRRVRTRRR